MNIFFVLFCCLSQPALGENTNKIGNTSNTSSSGPFGHCQQLQRHAADLQFNSVYFFNKKAPPLFISICRDAHPKVFEQFFAYLHTSKAQPEITPKAGLNRIKAIIKPDHKVFATGVVAMQQASLEKVIHIYQLRMRVRINDGDFTDLVVDMAVPEGQVETVNQKGFSITLAKPLKPGSGL